MADHPRRFYWLLRQKAVRWSVASGVGAAGIQGPVVRRPADLLLPDRGRFAWPADHGGFNRQPVLKIAG
jgi:hypothetical protein